MNCDKKGHVLGTVCAGSMTIHFSGKLFLVSPIMKTLRWVHVRLLEKQNGIALDGVDKVGDRVNEEQDAGYGTCITMGSFVRKGVKVGSDKELMEVRYMDKYN